MAYVFDNFALQKYAARIYPQKTKIRAKGSFP